MPEAELHHIGATAVPGAITKGDVDIVARVAVEDFAAARESLKRHFAVKQPENWTKEFASFGDDRSRDLPVSIQLVIRDSRLDFLLYLRNYLREDPAALQEYNRLKTVHARDDAEGYWTAKDKFLAGILATRK